MSLTQTVTQEQIAHAEHTAEGLRNEHDGIMLGDLGTPANSDQSAVHQQELGSPRSEHFEVQQRWNQPISNVWKLAATFYSFIAFGMNDACYGALLPSIRTYYSLSYTVVSLLFLAPFAGYSAAAVFSNKIHESLGQRGVAILGPVPRLIAYIVICTQPPFPVIVVILALAGLGNGVIEAGWNAYVGNLANPNELLGFLHGFFGVGATISPVIVASMLNTYDLPWYTFFYLMIGVVSLEFLTSLAVFWHEDGATYRKKRGPTEKETGMTKMALKTRTTLVISAFLLAYVGTEVTLGGWIIEFMIQVRKEEPFASGLTATGFWLGITVGRFVLGFITPRLGEKLAVTIYLALAVGLQLVFWLVPQFIVSAVAVAFIGFFLGPLFPAAVVAVTKILPSKLHVPAIGISAAIGGCGAAILPFAVGAVVQAAGVKTLQPIVVALLVLLIGIWFMLPRIPKRGHVE